MNDTYITIIGSIVGDPQTGFRTVYNWDGATFTTKPEAVDNGFRAGRSDDFNVGVVRGGRLASFWWMDEQFAVPPDALADIGREVGLSGY